MTRLVRALPLVLTALSTGVSATNIFSGTVTALAADSITVVRSVPAKADVRRDFSRDAQTKMEGPAMKVKSRVTVRYKELGEGKFQALYIIVR